MFDLCALARKPSVGRTPGFLAALFVLAPTAAGQQGVPDDILGAKFAPTAEDVMAHVRMLTAEEMQGRDSGTPGGIAAAKAIAAVLAELGLQPAGDDGGFEQGFDRMQAWRAPGDDGKVTVRKIRCRNVVAWLPGSDEKLAEEYLLVGAHYDHLGVRDGVVYPGADDNASGVAGMLAIARALAKGAHKPRRSVLFVAFDAEERGLQGSRHFVRHPPRSLHKLVAMINLDMIGRSRLLDQKKLGWAKGLVGIADRPAVGVIGTGQSPELDRIARAVFGAADLPLFAPRDFGVLRKFIKKMADGRADHAPFEQRGIPYLFFSTSESDDYHRPTDTVDKIDGETLARIAACTYRVVLAIDALDTRPTFVKPKPRESKKRKER